MMSKDIILSVNYFIQSFLVNKTFNDFNDLQVSNILNNKRLKIINNNFTLTLFNGIYYIIYFNILGTYFAALKTMAYVYY